MVAMDKTINKNGNH